MYSPVSTIMEIVATTKIAAGLAIRANSAIMIKLPMQLYPARLPSGHCELPSHEQLAKHLHRYVMDSIISCKPMEPGCRNEVTDGGS